MTAQLTLETFPDEAAAAYIRGKAVASPENFGNLPAQLKQRAFTVAGIEQMDVLRRMRDIIARLPEGTSWDEAKRGLAAEISPPCCSMICLTMERPRPVPPVSLERALSTR